MALRGSIRLTERIALHKPNSKSKKVKEEDPGTSLSAGVAQLSLNENDVRPKKEFVGLFDESIPVDEFLELDYKNIIASKKIKPIIKNASDKAVDIYEEYFDELFDYDYTYESMKDWTNCFKLCQVEEPLASKVFTMRTVSPKRYRAFSNEYTDTRQQLLWAKVFSDRLSELLAPKVDAISEHNPNPNGQYLGIWLQCSFLRLVETLDPIHPTDQSMASYFDNGGNTYELALWYCDQCDTNQRIAISYIVGNYKSFMKKKKKSNSSGKRFDMRDLLNAVENDRGFVFDHPQPQFKVRRRKLKRSHVSHDNHQIESDDEFQDPYTFYTDVGSTRFKMVRDEDDNVDIFPY
ncbi:hypothetical protein HYPBUDRAFT_166218 [Hyphopichia burtonii NRRL Y-1933]|uniref:Uncharacterized protein n=1 Tax=Hyphopichia burtonii NRRL Y-1933 TaxID=984485 RepID=A0A1E4RKE3_9ASCO|nr:hypothetical protein HYPBUDRAFT_166218 [Hyphopichia burtonii NRRL Y-1933]ODV67754.1 hypothetical protein HYPBUDRAFT_166218 [Hyphopichia burtonii NRRL Y-1933]